MRIAFSNARSIPKLPKREQGKSNQFFWGGNDQKEWDYLREKAPNYADKGGIKREVQQMGHNRVIIGKKVSPKKFKSIYKIPFFVYNV